MALRKRKLKELILYVAFRSSDDPRFGAVKLNKILFFADFEAYRRLGESITGATYQHLDEGPAPRAFVPMRDELLAEEAIRVSRREYFGGEQQRIEPLRAPKLDLFSIAELEIVEEVIRELWQLNAKQASELSHYEPAWQLTRSGEDIPYAAAWLSPEPITPELAAIGQKIADERGIR
jgi:hypothetical protein